MVNQEASTKHQIHWSIDQKSISSLPRTLQAPNTKSIDPLIKSPFHHCPGLCKPRFIYMMSMQLLQTYSDESNQSKKTKDHHQTKQTKNTHEFTNTLQQTNITVEIPPFAWLPHGALAWAPQPCQGASGSWSPTCDSGELSIKQHNFMDTTG